MVSNVDISSGISVVDGNMLGVPSFPAANSTQRLSSSSSSTSDRTKVALKPGRSLMHWIKLANGPIDIQGFKGRTQPIKLTELIKHNKIDDCWMAIQGKVLSWQCVVQD